MEHVLAWLFVLELLGIAALPYTLLAFPLLPDRGLAFAKPLGVLLTAYLLWMLGTMHAIPNGRGAAVLAALAVALGGLLLWGRHRTELAGFMRRALPTLVFYDLLFAAAFLAWAVVRAFNPEIDGTEKPMDLAMLNTALRSTTFPPADPWLSGYSVNYYYFGYLIVACITQLTGTPAAVGFNLGLAFLFAATCVGACGLVTNLVLLHGGAKDLASGLPRRALLYGGLGVLFVVVLGNLEGVLELARVRGWGSQDFWQWVAIKTDSDITTGLWNLLGVLPGDRPLPTPSWHPQDNWWWWRASRVVDTVAGGRSLDYTINEFPFFSFLLGDLHAHVMALPFVLLALGLTLQLFLGPPPTFESWTRTRPFRLLLPMLALGGLGFINGWDLVPYLGLYMAAGAVRTRVDAGGPPRTVWLGFLGWAALMGAGAFALYAPFYAPLAAQVAAARLSQAAEAGASGFPLGVWLGPGTRPLHFLLFWGPFVAITAAFLLAAVRRSLPQRWFGAAVLLGLTAVGWTAIEVAPRLGVPDPALGPLLLLQRTWFLAPMVVGLWLLLSRSGDKSTATRQPLSDSARFCALLVVFAFMLLLVSENFYIRDVFQNRMNTVFKLYYQTWVVLAVASAAALFYVYQGWSGHADNRWGRLLLAGGMASVICGGLVYPIMALPSKTNDFAGPATLNGLRHAQLADPQEAEALAWLREQVRQPDAVVLEATGPQYSHFGRVATATGIPTVLGWAGSEVQWRGSDQAFRGRAEDIQRIYTTTDKTSTRPLIEKYSITHIYIGALEASTFPPEGLAAFNGPFRLVFENAGVKIYQTRAAG